MAKTLLNKKKRQEILQIIYKHLSKKYKEFNKDLFEKEWQNKIVNELDTIIREYYNYPFYKNEENIELLTKLGFGHFENFWQQIPSNELSNNIFELSFRIDGYSTLPVGRNRPYDKDEDIDCIFYRHKYRDSDCAIIRFKNACQDFVENLYNKTKDVVNYVYSCRTVEDVLKIFDYEEIRNLTNSATNKPLTMWSVAKLNELKQFVKENDEQN